MIPREVECLLDKFTSNVTTCIGFERKDNDWYICHKHDATACLSFPRRFLAGNIFFTARVGLRFETLVIWLHDDPSETGPTLSQSINLLRKDKTYIEWEFSNVGDFEKLQDTVLNDLKTYALPYIERYSRIADLRKVLESPNKQDWLAAGLNVDNRVSVLAAIMFTEGDKIGAIRTLDDGIKILKETLAGHSHQIRKRTFSMEYLRDRFRKEK